MNRKPKCVIVTGRQGSGKTTLAKKLGERLWMPVIHRDEIKEGYVTTFGIRHDELPPTANGLVTDFFFRLVNEYLAAASRSSSKPRFSTRFGSRECRRSWRLRKLRSFCVMPMMR